MSDTSIPIPPPLPTNADMFRFVPLAPPLPISSQSRQTPIPTTVSSKLDIIQCCGVCYSMDLEGWTCPDHHSFCVGCMKQYVVGKAAEGIAVIKCLETCSYHVDDDCIEAILGEEKFKAFQKRSQLILNKNLRECPSCGELVLGSDSNVDLECSNCHQKFCYFHELSHVGKECKMKKASIIGQIKTHIWARIHTRQCPKCHNGIEKNGGCPHMTCRCGHEICWKCGQDYEKNGRRGHDFSLFPSPSNFKYCCNGKNMWTKRILASLAIIPLGSLAIAVAIPVVPTAVVARYLKNTYYRWASRQRRQRQRRHVHHEVDVSEMCEGYYTSTGRTSECRLCSNQIPSCEHEYPDASQADPFCCTLCGHWELHDNACAHFFGQDHVCIFCNLPSPQSSSSSLPRIALDDETIHIAFAEPVRLPSSCALEDLPVETIYNLDGSMDIII